VVQEAIEWAVSQVERRGGVRGFLSVSSTLDMDVTLAAVQG